MEWPGIKDGHLAATPGKLIGNCQPDQARADDHNIAFFIHPCFSRFTAAKS